MYAYRQLHGSGRPGIFSLCVHDMFRMKNQTSFRGRFMLKSDYEETLYWNNSTAASDLAAVFFLTRDNDYIAVCIEPRKSNHKKSHSPGCFFFPVIRTFWLFFRGMIFSTECIRACINRQYECMSHRKIVISCVCGRVGSLPCACDACMYVYMHTDFT
jgi:hypothetical protein